MSHSLLLGQNLDEPFEVFQPPSALGLVTDHSSIVSKGFVLPRQVVHREGHWHKSVGVWLYDKSSKCVLVQQRSLHKDTFPGFWDMSVAGHVDPVDLSPSAALLREISEELGLVATCIAALTLVAVFADSRKLPDRHISDNEFKYVFIAELTADAVISPLPAEVARVQWLPLTAIFPLGADFVPRPFDECAAIAQALHVALDL